MKILDLASLRGCCQSLPDLRQGGDVRYTMADIGLSAFSLFFMQSPSFLAHQRRLEEGQGRSNCQTLFGLDKIPSDNHVRALLDPASPDHFHPVFAEVVAELERLDGLKDFRQLGDHVLIALDGTEYHVSSKVRCQHCSTRRRGKDKTEHFHAMVSATIVAPTGWCRWSRNSSCPRMAMTSRTAKAGRLAGASRPAPRPAEAHLSRR